MVNPRSLFRALRTVSLALSCYALWLLVSQDTSTASLLMGALFAVLAASISQDAFFEPGVLHRSDLFSRVDLLVLFVLLVIVQSYLSSIDIIARMITGRYRPGVVRIRTRLQSQIGRSVLANTISLVPGTLSLWLEDQHIYVHCFDKKTHHSRRARKMITGQLEPLLKRVFG